MLRLMSMFAGNSVGASPAQTRVAVSSHQQGQPPMIARPFIVPASLSSPVLLFRCMSTKPHTYYDALVNWPAANGNSLLHDRIKNCYTSDGVVDFGVVDTLIDEVGLDAVKAMSIIVNNDGRLPVHLLANLPFSACERDKHSKLYQKMYDLMQSYPVIGLNDQLDIDAINRRINLDNDDQVRTVLTIIVEAVNLTRNEISCSNTHPSYNELDSNRKRRIDDAIGKTRANGGRGSIPLTDEMLARAAASAKRFAHGNCHEYSCVLAEHLVKQLPEISVEIVMVKYGDHAFVVVGRDQQSDIATPETWGANTIVCDAWVGDVYRANELDKRLLTSSFISMSSGEDLRVLKSYNPKYHGLRLIYSANAQTAACSPRNRRQA